MSIIFLYDPIYNLLLISMTFSKIINYDLIALNVYYSLVNNESWILQGFANYFVSFDVTFVYIYVIIFNLTIVCINLININFYTLNRV